MPYTVVQTAVPESIGFMPTLLYRPKSQRFINVGTAREMGQRPDRSIKLESDWLRKNNYIYVRDDQEDVWVRELFSPTFVAWLESTAPGDFGWEMEAGSLTALSEGHATDPARLDELCEATAYVAKRFHEESLEDHSSGSLGSMRATESQRIDAAVAKVDFEDAPDSTAEAADEYEDVARKESDARKAGAFIGLLVTGLAIAFTRSIVAGIAFGLIVGFLAYRGFARARSKQYGEQAFLERYASDRGMTLEPAREFQSRHATAGLPGTVYGVLSGTVPGSSIEGSIVLTSDDSDRKNPKDYDVLFADGRVLTSSRAPKREDRTAEALDAFCKNAVAQMEREP